MLVIVMKYKGCYYVFIGLILAMSTIGCSKDYMDVRTQEDVVSAYRQGYEDGYAAASKNSPSPTPTPTPTPVPTSKPVNIPTPQVINKGDISFLDYSVTEKNNSWWKYSWKLTLDNNTSSVVDFVVKVKFLNISDYIIDDDLEAPPSFAPHERRVITGYALIDSELAPSVHDAEAEIYAAYIVD